jgi:hypothetical protein
MANMVYDLIEPAVLIDFVRVFSNEVLRAENRFTLDRWLPNRLTNDLEFRIRKGDFTDVDIAEYRAFDTPAVMTGRPGVSRISGKLGPVSRQIPLGEEEYLRQRALETGTDDPIITAIFDDAERMTRSVQARVEAARGDIIDDGIVTIAENGLVLEADFNRSGSMSVIAATVWTNPAAEMLSEMLAWQQAYIDLNGSEPAVMLMPKTRVANFALNTEMREYASANGTTPNRINRATIDNIFSNEGLPPIETYDVSVRKDGVATRVLPLDKIYFMPATSEPIGNTFYGPTAEALKLRAKGLIEADAVPGIVAVVTETDHPVQTFTVGTGLILPAMPNPDLILDATVI